MLDDTLMRSEITWVTDPESLLPGEDPTSVEVRDAVHWVQVYGELIGMTSALLERSEPTVRGMHSDAATEAGGTLEGPARTAPAVSGEIRVLARPCNRVEPASWVGCTCERGGSH